MAKSFEEIQTILNKWNELYENIEHFNNEKSVYNKNWMYLIKSCRILSEYIYNNIDILKEWWNEYLKENRNELFIRFSLKYISDRLLKGIDWRCYSTSAIKPEIIEQWAQIFPISHYEEAKEIVKTTLSKKDEKFCDDPEILKIHEGKEHYGYNWGCYYCDEVQDKWENKLYDSIKNSNNIFLNRTLQEDFIQKNKTSIDIGEWIPIRVCDYYDSVEEYHDLNKNTREELNKLSGKTQYQMSEKYFKECLYEWRVSYKIKFDTPFNLFYTLWPFLENILYYVEKDLEFMKKIESY